MTSSFRVPLQQLVEYNREQDWRNTGVPEVDIRTSAQTGMDARDVWHLRLLSQKRWLIIVRCPKRTAPTPSSTNTAENPDTKARQANITWRRCTRSRTGSDPAASAST